MVAVIPLSAFTDSMQAWGSVVGAVATVAATAGAWIAVKVSLNTAKQAEADHARENADRAAERKYQRAAQARNIRMTPVKGGSQHGSRQEGMHVTYSLTVTNHSDDVIHDIIVSLFLNPKSAHHPDSENQTSAVRVKDVMVPGEELTVTLNELVHWSEERRGAAAHEALPTLQFTDVNQLRWQRAADLRLEEVPSSRPNSDA